MPTPSYSLIVISFIDKRSVGVGKSITLSIDWDNDTHQFNFNGDIELVTPAARMFFDELTACANDWFNQNYESK